MTISAFDLSDVSSVQRIGKMANVNAAMRTAYAMPSYMRWVWRRERSMRPTRG